MEKAARAATPGSAPRTCRRTGSAPGRTPSFTEATVITRARARRSPRRRPCVTRARPGHRRRRLRAHRDRREPDGPGHRGPRPPRQRHLRRQRRVRVADGAALSVVSLQDWADDTVHLSHHHAQLGRDAKITHFARHPGRRPGPDRRRPSPTPGRAATPSCTGSTSPTPGSTRSTGCSSTTACPTAAAGSVQGRPAGRRGAQRLDRRRADPRRGHRDRHLRVQPEPGPHRRRPGRLGAEPGDPHRRGRRGRARQRQRPARRRAPVLPDGPGHPRTRRPGAWSSGASSASCWPRSKSARSGTGWPGWSRRSWHEHAASARSFASAPLADVPEDGALGLDVDGTPVAVVRTGDEVLRAARRVLARRGPAVRGRGLRPHDRVLAARVLLRPTDRRAHRAARHRARAGVPGQNRGRRRVRRSQLTLLKNSGLTETLIFTETPLEN